MPKTVYLDINQNYKPKDAEDKAKFESLKKNFRNHRPVSMVTASENLRNAKGMLRVRPDVPATPPPQMDYDAMPTEQLKMMMLAAGITPTKKQMSRDEIIRSIRTKLAAIEVAEDD